jgi:tetratricopeptide (TPR) repeat protein
MANPLSSADDTDLSVQKIFDLSSIDANLTRDLDLIKQKACSKLSLMFREFVTDNYKNDLLKNRGLAIYALIKTGAELFMELREFSHAVESWKQLAHHCRYI